MHESVDASGTTHFTVTDTPDHVSLVDENGNVYSLRGATWFGGRNERNPDRHPVGCVNPSVTLLGVFVDECAEAVASAEVIRRVGADTA
jgi:hypothetical protein